MRLPQARSPARRRYRELEADVGRHRGVEQQEPGYREAQRRRGAPGPAGLARHQHHATHECGAHDARATTREEREHAQRHHDADRATPASETGRGEQAIR